jgi:hypothetical protein
MVVKDIINVSDNRLLDGLVPVVRIRTVVALRIPVNASMFNYINYIE